ncbi:unnamed protein product [Microthlaspi erraticum]|uniref:Arabidopsis retrotransposon Orf1 C-terminal domain-containing protein n=1 Tax=Microthlaspi erraticum TaxID=1685480 RepID=A0A6D2HUT2_9BRAS|nr:unnamed protein product [Microthlaspi erraticum]
MWDIINTLIDHKELDGKYQFLFKHPIAGHSKMLLPNNSFTTVVEGNNIDFSPPLHTLVGHEDEPLCCDCSQEVGLLQKFNKWQGKAIKTMKKSMDKMVSKIKSLEKKVSGSSSKKKKTPMASPFPRSRSLLTTPRGLPAQEPHRASSFEPREGGSPHRRRKSSRARRSNSTSGLDRVQTEEIQLGRADG